jgi:DNA polymerase-4
MRLRTNKLWAASVGLAVGFAVPRNPQGMPTPVSSFGVPSKGWHAELKVTECQDNQILIAALRKLWDQQPRGGHHDRPFFVGVHLGGLVPDRLHTLSLFDASEDEQSRARLLKVMDQINQKYGLSTVAPATMLSAYKAAPTRIAFHSIPDLF